MAKRNLNGVVEVMFLLYPELRLVFPFAHYVPGVPSIGSEVDPIRSLWKREPRSY